MCSSLWLVLCMRGERTVLPTGRDRDVRRPGGQRNSQYTSLGLGLGFIALKMCCCWSCSYCDSVFAVAVESQARNCVSVMCAAARWTTAQSGTGLIGPTCISQDKRSSQRTREPTIYKDTVEVR